MCSFRKIVHTPPPPPQKGLEIPGRGRGVSKAQKLNAMDEAKLEFPKGRGVIGQIPSVGVRIFSGTTQ